MTITFLLEPTPAAGIHLLSARSACAGYSARDYRSIGSERAHRCAAAMQAWPQNRNGCAFLWPNAVFLGTMCIVRSLGRKKARGIT